MNQTKPKKKKINWPLIMMFVSAGGAALFAVIVRKKVEQYTANSSPMTQTKENADQNSKMSTKPEPFYLETTGAGVVPAGSQIPINLIVTPTMDCRNITIELQPRGDLQITQGNTLLQSIGCDKLAHSIAIQLPAGGYGFVMVHVTYDSNGQKIQGVKGVAFDTVEGIQRKVSKDQLVDSPNGTGENKEVVPLQIK